MRKRTQVGGEPIFVCGQRDRSVANRVGEEEGGENKIERKRDWQEHAPDSLASLVVAQGDLTVWPNRLSYSTSPASSWRAMVVDGPSSDQLVLARKQEGFGANVGMNYYGRDENDERCTTTSWFKAQSFVLPPWPMDNL